MNEKLINNWNARVKKEDMVFHLGDFCFKNTPKQIGRGEGYIHPASYYESLLNGKIIQIQGSHDDNNSCRTPIKKIIIELGGKKILLIHDLIDIADEFQSIKEGKIDLIFCGHVHQNWRLSEVCNLPVVNVGVDVWDYNPVDINEILRVLP
jgi:calcineurin-like phosphoesterase family protein